MIGVSLHRVVAAQLKSKATDIGCSATELVSWLVMEFAVRRKERPVPGCPVFEACRIKKPGREIKPPKIKPPKPKYRLNSRGRLVRTRFKTASGKFRLVGEDTRETQAVPGGRWS